MGERTILKVASGLLAFFRRSLGSDAVAHADTLEIVERFTTLLLEGFMSAREKQMRRWRAEIASNCAVSGHSQSNNAARGSEGTRVPANR